jgi:UDP-glucose:(heptosyl)LPS alpha-1,3-glucosyltransferase
MKQKIAIIIERADVGLGGAERSVSELAGALRATGYDVDVLAAKGQASAQNVHILCADQPGKRTSYGVFARALRKHIEGSYYDIIHSVLPFDFADVYQPRGGTYAEAIIRNADSFGNKFIAGWKRATGFLNPRRSALQRAERDLCQKQDGPAIIAISQYVAEQFKRHYGVDASRTTVIPNGVETENVAFEKAGELRAQILSQLGVQKDISPVLFLFAANNFRLKGLACLLKAMKMVLSGRTSRPAFLVAAGSDNQAPYRRLASNLNIEREVLFLGSVSDIGNLLAAADVAVLPTFYDPCSRFILEALAVCKPVITTKFNGAAELFTNNRHGRIVDRPDDIAALADALVYFTDPANIQKASQAILRDGIRQQVSISRAADRLKKVYDAIIAKRRRQ